MNDKKNNDGKLYNIARPEAVTKAYHERLKILKKAQEATKKEQIPIAVQHYSYYLNILAQYHAVDESSLSPILFNKEKDLAEILLISHAYWELAKAYDRSPSLANESVRCLKQFILFSQGFKFQFANALMIKKYIRLKMAHNSKAFKEAYEKIHVTSKGCYIASYCYGEDHLITDSLRSYREQKLRSTYLGRCFIHFYEFYSPKLVKVAQRFPLLNVMIKPMMYLLIKGFIVFLGVQIKL
jgi:phosphorylcholine metabolism protein LicD